MKKIIKSAYGLVVAVLLITNKNYIVYGQGMSDLALCAGAPVKMESTVVEVSEEKKKESIDFVKTIVGDTDDDIAEEDTLADQDTLSENEVITPVDLEKDDPIYQLYGDDIVMSDVNDSVNMRMDPDEESEIVGKLYHDCAGEMLYQRNGWTRIRSGSVVGWVRDDYLFFGQEAVDNARQAGAMVATVTTQTLRVREDANEDAAVYGLLAENDQIEVVQEDEETDGWIRVVYDDDSEGYVSDEFVSLEYHLDEAESIEEIKEREAIEAAKKAREAEEKAKIEASRTRQTTTTNNGGIVAATDDVTLLAALIQAECGREAYEGKLAVGAVVVNRARGRYGSIANAVYAPGQFGPAASGKVAAIAAIGPTAECRRAAQEAINGVSNVGGATHFRNIRSGYAGIVIGNHVFW